mgnify:FL=1
MLKIDKVTKTFGGITALSDVSFDIAENEFIGLIGPNGSGKTTLFNVLSGSIKPTKGSIKLKNMELIGLPSNKICHLGIARTFQIPKPIKSISVLENVMIGAVYGSQNGKKNEHKIKEECQKLIEFIGLDIDYNSTPDKLTAGDLRRLELARALATKPDLLLADEILSGLNKDELDSAAKVLQNIRDKMGITIIWVEHIMGQLMNLVDRAIVLNYGSLIADDTPENVSNDPMVIEAYLG